MEKSKKEQLFDILQIGDRTNIISHGFDYFLVANILLNILVVFLETFSQLQAYHDTFKIIEIVTTMVFCVEYILRIWTAEYLYPTESRGSARLHFLRSFDGIVDLLTIIPVFFLSGFIAFRILRVVRIFHLFRINAKTDSFSVIITVINKKKAQIASSLLIILILMLASSLCMYSVEHDAQPEAFKNAFSGLWWSVSAMLTVGYGDICPITVMGRVLGIIIAFLGVGVVAIPTGIISAGFVEEYTLSQTSDKKLADIDKIGEVLVSSESEFLGKSIYSIRHDYHLTVYMVLRDDMSILATDNLIVAENDILVVQSEKLKKKKTESRFTKR